VPGVVRTSGARHNWHKGEIAGDRPEAYRAKLVTHQAVEMYHQPSLNYYRLKAGRLESFVSYGLKSFAHDGVT
jgi:hypothetical protein